MMFADDANYPVCGETHTNDRREVKDSQGMRLRVSTGSPSLLIVKRVDRKGRGDVLDIVEAARSLTRFYTVKRGVLRLNSIKTR